MKLVLNQKDIELISWALEAAIDQHGKFCQHDQWEDGLSKSQILMSKRNHRNLRIAKNHFRLAVIKAKETK